MKLLTPQDVADQLQLSVRTIMRHAKELGGFYPCGIRALRFRAEDIERACRVAVGPGVDQRVVNRVPDLDPGRHGL
jgi:hypothetical protein